MDSTFSVSVVTQLTQKEDISGEGGVQVLFLMEHMPKST